MQAHWGAWNLFIEFIYSNLLIEYSEFVYNMSLFCLESSHVFGNRSRLSSCSSMTENNGGETGRQYGIALFFPGDDKDFVFQHILQVEKEIFKLISSVHLAIASRAQFLNIIYEVGI